LLAKFPYHLDNMLDKTETIYTCTSLFAKKFYSLLPQPSILVLDY